MTTSYYADGVAQVKDAVRYAKLVADAKSSYCRLRDLPNAGVGEIVDVSIDDGYQKDYELLRDAAKDGAFSSAQVCCSYDDSSCDEQHAWSLLVEDGVCVEEHDRVLRLRVEDFDELLAIVKAAPGGLRKARLLKALDPPTEAEEVEDDDDEESEDI